MSTREDLEKAAERPDDVIAAVLRDHAEIKLLFGEVEQATDTEAKEDARNRLMRKLIVHETAEQEIVHPLMRQTGDPEASSAADERYDEEAEAEAMLADLEKLDASSSDFKATFSALQADVLEHAEAEEAYDHPHLDQHVDPEQLRQLASVFRIAEKAAPTRPHLHGPTSPAGKVAAGPFIAIADRVRDAIRDARN